MTLVLFCSWVASDGRTTLNKSFPPPHCNIWMLWSGSSLSSVSETEKMEKWRQWMLVIGKLNYRKKIQIFWHFNCCLNIVFLLSSEWRWVLKRSNSQPAMSWQTTRSVLLFERTLGSCPQRLSKAWHEHTESSSHNLICNATSWLCRCFSLYFNSRDRQRHIVLTGKTSDGHF